MMPTRFNRQRGLLAAVVLSSILIAVLVISFAAQANIARAQSKTLLTVFQAIQQKAQADPKFAFTIESYGAAASGPGLSIATVSGTAGTIVDMGDDYVCIGSQKVDASTDLKTVCVPFSAIVQAQAGNTLFN